MNFEKVQKETHELMRAYIECELGGYFDFIKSHQAFIDTSGHTNNRKLWNETIEKMIIEKPLYDFSIIHNSEDLATVIIDGVVIIEPEAGYTMETLKKEVLKNPNFFYKKYVEYKKNKYEPLKISEK